MADDYAKNQTYFTPITSSLAKSATKVFLGVFLAVFAVPGKAQVPSANVATAQNAPDLAAGQFMLRTWQIEDGLPQNTVSSIVQTDDGYIWMATEEGLARFNGEQFFVFDAANTGAFERSQSIRALATDSLNNLWIGTDGAGIVRRHGKQFETVDDELSRSGAQVVDLHVDAKNQVWASAAGNGLWIYGAGQSGRRVELPDSAIVFDATTDKSGRAYAATSLGLFEIGVEGQYRRIDVGFDGAGVRAAYIDATDRLWVSSRDRTVVVEARGSVDIYSNSGTLAYLQDRLGRLWFGLDGEGLLLSGWGNHKRFTTASGLPHDRVVSLFEDAEGSVWVGTEGGGVVQFAQSRFVTWGQPEGLPSDLILAVLATNQGVWAGTEGAGVVLLNDGEVFRLTTNDGLGDDIVTSLAQTSDGTVWVGTFFGGLSAVRDGRVVQTYTSEDGLPEGAVAALHVDDDGTLLIGTDGGLSRFDGTRFETTTTSDGLGSNYVTAVHRDRSGVLWIGTYDSGLYAIAGDSIMAVANVPETAVVDISEDRDGAVWVATVQEGVFVLKSSVWHHLSRTEGLPTNTIYSIVFDELDHVWMTSNKGLFALRRDGAFGQHRAPGVLNFGAVDGLRSVEFNGGVQPSGSLGPDGRLWFPSIKGLVSTKPEMPSDDILLPTLAIEGIRVKGQPMRVPHDLSEGLNLKPGQNKLELDVAAVTFRGLDRVRIEYRLTGQDQGWSEIKSGQSITYTNLAPRTSRLQLRVVVSHLEGETRGEIIELPVVLRPYFYQQPMFWAILVLLLVGLAFGVHRLAIRRIRHVERARQLVLEREVAERTRELSELNEQLEEKVADQVRSFMAERRKYEQSLLEARDKAQQSEELKSSLLTNLTHEFRTPISSIVGFSDILASDADEQSQEFLGYIRQSADRLLDSLTAIVDLAELEAAAVSSHTFAAPVEPVIREVIAGFREQAAEKGLKLIVEASDADLVGDIDPGLIRKVLTNLLSNAVKFTEAGTITVALSGRDQQVHVTVSDTGVGIDESFMPSLFEAFTQESTGETRAYEGCGLGLTVVNRLVALLGGSIDVTSEKGVGSTFTVRLPMARTAGGADRGPVGGRSSHPETEAHSFDRVTANRQDSSSSDTSV